MFNTVINDSYSNYKPDTRFPITVINIKCDPSLIDVNIHPTKMDVKFIIYRCIIFPCIYHT